MAVQAEFGESASEAGIRQVEVEPTAPISDVSISAGVSLTFFCRTWATGFHRLPKLLELNFFLQKVFPLDGQTSRPNFPCS